tara:strand:- start:2673 stop:3539 length:867 start_codon:yes stop_codon:yes gene_type:complete
LFIAHWKKIMKCENLLTPIAILLALALLSGCASTGITEYQEDHSRAWNLTHSVGMTQMKDKEVPSDQLPSNLRSAADMAIDVSYFMNSATMSMNFADAFGLGLIGLLTAADGHAERSTIIAWVPANEAKDQEAANVWLNSSLKDAALTAMENLEIEDIVESSERTDTILGDLYDTTRIEGINAEGKKCGIWYRTYPENISEEKPIPDFIVTNATGYQIYAGKDIAFPRMSVYCGSETLDPYLALINEVSKQLPDTVYLYSRVIKNGDQVIPPVAYDHGQAFLFLTEKD